MDEGILGDVPTRQYVVTIPKMLHLDFKYDRSLLGELSRCFYDSIKEIYLAAASMTAESSKESYAILGSTTVLNARPPLLRPGA